MSFSFFRRKKPDAPAKPGASIEELAAAFPKAPSEATADNPAPGQGFPAPPDQAVAAEAPAAAGAAGQAAPGQGEPSPRAHDVASAAGAAAAAPDAPLPPEPIPPATAPAPAVAAASDEPAVDAGREKPAAPAGKPGWRERLRNSTFARAFGGLFSGNPRLDDELLDEIETALITADVGVAATTALVDELRKRMKAREFADAGALLAALRAELVAMLRPVSVPLRIDPGARPFVVLTVGVNGVGKTTTIGKLAKRFKDEGHSLMLAAGDTFRAAAVAQLQAWGQRNGVAVIAQGQDADPASVAFDALQAARARGTEVLIADTAGRLHTQTGLMNELGKIKRVLGKLDPSAPHEVLMVIDGTTGQNALSQLRQFNAVVQVTGLVVTKLDGTAKGGVVFALAREFGIPIRFAGIGERPEDLRVFDPEAFVDALLPEALGS
ncbi:signal recognition particle-docking protein FtsY [Xanthomonas massiliensis]|uniref:signal recognition particle-docking protein FtsY n=1 Tax=Xanthomonas massiliensis TaxID=1720302 RepID=UPI000825FC01|nr:signal recognition particle-docking protein FtsY [Xanthomonas massiliensis]